ncbi:MAG: purine-binding chemotaxis protein CheW [Xanthomonadaceae bacterium]|nr:purine-binding chemotaxis protein CheW [Xanthomonadaceae bacterium]
MNSNRPASENSEKTAAIDWRGIERRLEAARIAIEHGRAPSAEQARQILKARALALAAEPLPAEAPGECIEIVEFVLAHERYALESRYVREVHPLENLTPLPCVPRFVLGIVNLRGEILVVIDLKTFFDLPAKGLTDLDKVVVLHSGNMIFGVLADAIVGVRHVPLADIQPALPTLTGIRGDYLQGVTAGRLVVLDAGKLLADEGIAGKILSMS